MVKIDGSFVRNISECAENQLFVRNLLSLARTFSLVTVAECVESAEDASYLLREGVDLLQGYHFGKPQVRPQWKLEAEEAAYAGAESEPAYRMSSQQAAR